MGKRPKTDPARIDALTDEETLRRAQEDPDAQPTDAAFWEDVPLIVRLEHIVTAYELFQRWPGIVNEFELFNLIDYGQIAAFRLEKHLINDNGVVIYFCTKIDKPEVNFDGLYGNSTFLWDKTVFDKRNIEDYESTHEELKWKPVPGPNEQDDSSSGEFHKPQKATKPRRKRKPVSCPEAAKMCDVSVSLIEKWEKGTRESRPIDYPGREDAVAFRAWVERYKSRKALEAAAKGMGRATPTDPKVLEDTAERSAFSDD